MSQSGTQNLHTIQETSDRRLKYLDREMARHSYNQSGLLEVLFKANGLFGFLPDDILRYIAKSLNVAPSRVFATATFYSRFSTDVQKEPAVHICNGISCRMNGSKELNTSLMGPALHPVPAQCSGLCGHGPIAYVAGNAIINATPDAVRSALQEAEGARV